MKAGRLILWILIGGFVFFTVTSIVFGIDWGVKLGLAGGR